jgi:hypothetical protein
MNFYLVVTGKEVGPRHDSKGRDNVRGRLAWTVVAAIRVTRDIRDGSS